MAAPLKERVLYLHHEFWSLASSAENNKVFVGVFWRFGDLVIKVCLTQAKRVLTAGM